MLCSVLFAMVVLGVEAEHVNPCSGCTVNQMVCPGHPDGSILSVPGGEASCPYPFTRVRDVCLYLSRATRSWNSARVYCQGLGGDLATYRRLYLLQAFITDSGVSGEVWVGGMELPDGKTWQWIDKTEIDLSMWHTTLPWARAGDNDCTYLSYLSYPPLANYPCGRTFNFLCQYH